MKKIIEGLFIGNDDDCHGVGGDFLGFVIHACKTCHSRVLGYSGSLNKENPDYLIFERPNELFLNIVDMRLPPDHKFMYPIFERALLTIHHCLKFKVPVLVHCNEGKSRAPSLVLFYMAKNKLIRDDFFQNAREDFVKFYPNYLPSLGLETYLNNYWRLLCK